MNDLFLKITSLTSYPLLGEGVWGRVFDLGDGTVIKIAKAAGGIGDGVEKLLKEQHLLEVFESSGAASLPFQLPRCIATGEVKEDHPLFAEGFRRWMISTKVSGRPLKIEQAKQFSAADQARAAQNLAGTLFTFHQFVNRTLLAPTLGPDPVFESIRADRLPLTRDEKILCSQVEHLCAAQSNTTVIHGDFNISNVLMDDHYNVTGILDFAETCLGHREDDLASLIDEMPFMREALLDHYSQTSGVELNSSLITLAEAKRAMIGMLICRHRLNDPISADKNERQLKNHLKAMKPETKKPDLNIKNSL